MRDVALVAAGALAIAVAVVHAAVLELRVFPKAQIEPRGTRTLLHLVSQLSTIDWIAVGILVMAAPAFGSQARHWIIAVAAIVYGSAAAANAAAVRGWHPGWVLMSCVVVLALAGL